EFISWQAVILDGAASALIPVNPQGTSKSLNKGGQRFRINHAGVAASSLRTCQDNSQGLRPFAA
ncbi:MAG: hypothetical protein L0312_10365, partial [Acidobacteria bacterium]|nr:hypothetical protein [Acidobacteriota bacterium]